MLGPISPAPPDNDVRWSVLIRDVDTGQVAFQQAPDERLRTASVGKLLLLIQVARLLTVGTLDPGEMLARTEADAVADSGVWQHLSVGALSVADLAQLIGMASDNLATNVLLRRVGLAAVARTAADLGLTTTALLDRVRDRRGPEHPWTLSTGSAGELATLLGGLATGAVFDPATSKLVLAWLRDGLDLSMVAAGWGLDPLAHALPDRSFQLHHKTGTDDGVRCDVGVLAGPQRTAAYAVLANWDPAGPDSRDEVMARMRQIGVQLRTWVSDGA